MDIKAELTEGIFIEESKNRFMCKVLVNGEVLECYVPSASKLNNYLILKGKIVLLIKNKGEKTRTKFSLFAIRYYRKYIILNLAIANDVVEEYLQRRYTSYEISKEKYIDDYKSDFIIYGEKTIAIEVKGIIAPRNKVLFPTVYSQRAVRQLKWIIKLLEKGWMVQYFYISLSPIVNEIEINCKHPFTEYGSLLKECVSRGMALKGLNIYYENNEIKIGSPLKILI